VYFWALEEKEEEKEEEEEEEERREVWELVHAESGKRVAAVLD